MSTQELLAEIQKLSHGQRQDLLDALKRDSNEESGPPQPLSEDEVEQILFAAALSLRFLIHPHTQTKTLSFPKVGPK